MPHIELPVPLTAEVGPNAAELARCWFADGEFYVSLKWDIGDPNSRQELTMSHKHASAWGSVLHQIARHAASAIAGEDDEEYVAMLRRILASFNAEVVSYLKGGDEEASE